MEKKCAVGEEPRAVLRKTPSLHERLIQCKQRSFDKDYTVKRKIGEGSFGEVYEVVHNTLGLRRALKVVRNTQASPYPSKYEIDVLVHLDHPNILRLYEFYEVKNRFFLVTEYFYGEELFAEIIKQYPFTEYKACYIAEEILKALHYTHSKGIAHRDIKAENILVKREEDRWIVKIIDWGLGTIVGNGELVRKCGTPEYVAPEVFSNSYNEKCDLWSFGVILYIMLMGEMPFKGKSPMYTVKMVTTGDFPRVRNWPNLSVEARDLLSKLLVKNPQERLSASYCLNHQWFSRLHRSDYPPKALENTLRMIKHLHVSNTLSLVAFNFINNFLANYLDRRYLNRVFNWLDRDHNGVLSRDYMLRGYSEVYGEAVAIPIVDQVFCKLDTDHNNVLEYNEFITFAMMNNKEEQYQKFKEAFIMFDSDNDGRISVEETKALLCSNIDEEEFHIKEIIHQFDGNGDGLIDEEEFLSCLRSISEMFVEQEYLKKQSMAKIEEEQLRLEDKEKSKQYRSNQRAKNDKSDEKEEKEEKEDKDYKDTKYDKYDKEEKTKPATDFRSESISLDPKEPQPLLIESQVYEKSPRKKGRPKNSERKLYVPEPTTRTTRSKYKPK